MWKCYIQSTLSYISTINISRVMTRSFNNDLILLSQDMRNVPKAYHLLFVKQYCVIVK